MEGVPIFGRVSQPVSLERSVFSGAEGQISTTWRVLELKRVLEKRRRERETGSRYMRRLLVYHIAGLPIGQSL